jgi:hypothetical protein
MSKYLTPLTFFYNFNHSSYSRKISKYNFFVCYMLYYFMYCKIDLSFYMFVIIF